jgi:PAS domain S-box-containing protein
METAMTLVNAPNRVVGRERPGLEGTGLLAAAVQPSEDAIISADLDGTILSWNGRAKRMFGFTHAEIVGQSIDVLLSPDLQDEQLHILALVKQGEHVREYETVWTTKSGERIDVSLMLSPLNDAAGTIVGFSAIIRDITSYKRPERARLHRLKFETLLSELANTLIGVTEDEVGAHMVSGLARVGEFLEMDRVTLLEASRDRTDMSVTYSWSAPGVPMPPPVITKRDQPWWVDHVLRGEASLASQPDDLPDDAAADKNYLRHQGVQSAASIPFSVGGEIAGVTTFVTANRRVAWTDDLVRELKAIGDVLWNTLQRRQARRAWDAERNAVERTPRAGKAHRANEDRDRTRRQTTQLFAAQRDAAKRTVERAREAVAESAALYRTLAEQLTDGLIVTDATGRVLVANRGACDLMGYTLEELKALNPERVLPADVLSRLPDMAPASAVRDEWQFRRKDGSVFTGQVMSRRLANGRLQAVFRDISEREEAKESERRLHQIAMLSLNNVTLEEVLETILEAAIAIAHADFGSIQLLDANASHLHLVAQRGFPAGWIDYWRVTPLKHGACGTALSVGERVVIEDVERSPIFSGADLDMQRQAGVRAVQSTRLVSRSGKPIGMLSTHYKTPRRPDQRTLERLDVLAREAADILGHTQAQANVKRQAALLDLAQNSILVRDFEGHILYWNEGATQCYGWTQDEALGKVTHALLRTQFPEPLDRILETLRSTGHWQGELDHTRRDGRHVIVDSRWTLQDERDGEGDCILEINNDITERKHLEQERAEEARRKDEFLAFMGHELRNPLAAIHTAGHVLTRNPSPERRARMEDIINRQTTIMRRLVDDLLDLERITHGHIELKLGPVDLAECLHRAVAAVESTLANRKQELLLQLPSDSVLFSADGARLDQIVLNLLTNASKYSARGSSIELSGAREDGHVVIRCKDNGQGIAPEHQQMIFEPFSRGPKTDLGYGEASVGLGLALVKQLTELHGGTIAVESKGAGLGSEFTVRLPLVAVAAVHGTADKEPTSAGMPRRQRSIVIVDDNPNVATALQAVLEQAGHTVHLFGDGPSALAGVSSLAPDAFLIDIGLPGMDGYELAAVLKQQTTTKSPLLVAISGFKRREHVATDSFDQYFNKPVDVAALLALLDER